MTKFTLLSTILLVAILMFTIPFFFIMPIIKSAIKADRQNKKRRIRNKHYKSRMKTLITNILCLAKKDKEKAKEILSEVYSAIDTALKKNILHKNNAARKKSKIAKALL